MNGQINPTKKDNNNAKSNWDFIHDLVSESTWSVRKVSDRIFLCEHLMDYNLARLHELTMNLSAHA